MRRVRGVHPGQPSAQRLEFKNGLERPLRDFRLVRRVRGIKIAARRQVIENRRDIVPVCPSSQEAGRSFSRQVGMIQLGQQRYDFRLGHPVRQVQLREADAFGDFAEKLVDRAHAERRQHGAAFGVGVRNEHGISADPRSTLRRPPRP